MYTAGGFSVTAKWNSRTTHFHEKLLCIPLIGKDIWVSMMAKEL